MEALGSRCGRHFYFAREATFLLCRDTCKLRLDKYYCLEYHTGIASSRLQRHFRLILVWVWKIDGTMDQDSLVLLFGLLIVILIALFPPGPGTPRRVKVTL